MYRIHAVQLHRGPALGKSEKLVFIEYQEYSKDIRQGTWLTKGGRVSWWGTVSNVKEESTNLFSVIGTLCAQDYALFVNHNRPDGQVRDAIVSVCLWCSEAGSWQVHFNVFTSPKARQDWGVFSTDVTLPFNASGGPDYSDFHEEEPVKYWTANKVSQVNPGRPWDAVLLARLRFKPDNDVPTSL